MKFENRYSKRYPSDAKIHYAVYDFDTEVDYSLIHEGINGTLSDKYVAQSRNVSIEGINFVSEKHLVSGDHLDMEVFIPTSTHSVHMKGEVRWSEKLIDATNKKFNTGVKVLTVEGQPVNDSIHFDEQYKIEWSLVLEKILGEYSKVSMERHDESKKE